MFNNPLIALLILESAVILISIGRLLQSLGALYEKDLSPVVLKIDLRTVRIKPSEDLSVLVKLHYFSRSFM